MANLKELDKYAWCGHHALMNPHKTTWQKIDYIYGLFSERKRQARKIYHEFVEKGTSLGKRPDLTGGGLVRSSGGWTILKANRKAGIRLKGDERILGDSDFVKNVLKSAKESFEQKYAIKADGYHINRVKERVAELLEIETEDVTARDKSPGTVKARSLLCYWAHQ